MYCNKCGSKNSEDAKYCRTCGNQLNNVYGVTEEQKGNDAGASDHRGRNLSGCDRKEERKRRISLYTEGMFAEGPQE